MATHSSILAWRIPTDREAWWAVVHGGHNQLDRTEQLSAQHAQDGIIKETNNTQHLVRS